MLLTMPIPHPDQEGRCLVDISMPHATLTFEGLNKDVSHSLTVIHT